MTSPVRPLRARAGGPGVLWMELGASPRPTDWQLFGDGGRCAAESAGQISEVDGLGVGETAEGGK